MIDDHNLRPLVRCCLALFLGAAAGTVVWPAPAPGDKDSRTQEQIQAAKDDLKQLEDMVRAAKPDLRSVWQVWGAFRQKHGGTPEWVRAAEVMREVPSPLDTLDGGLMAVDDRPAWLPKEVVAVLGEHRARHTGAVHQVAVSSDGRTVLSASNDGVRIWDGETMREHYFLEGVPFMALFPDCQTLAADGKDGDIDLWDLGGAKPNKRAKLHGHPWRPSAMAVTADGKTLVSAVRPASLDRPIRVWDVSSDEPKALPSLDRDKYDWGTILCASKAMTMVDAGGPDKTPIRVWDMDKDGPRVRCMVTAHRQDPGPMALSPDGKLLATEHIQRPEAVVLWDVSGAEPKGLDTLEGYKFWAFTFSPNGRMLAVAGRDRTLRLWPVNEAGRKDLGLAEGQQFASFPLGFSAGALAFSGDGKTLVLGGWDGVVHVWDMERHAERFPQHGHTGWVWCLDFSPDGKTLASGGGDGTVRLWDLTGAKAKEAAKLEAHTATVTAVAFASDGKTLASASSGLDVTGAWTEEKAARLWDLSGKEPRPIGSWEPHSDRVNSLAFEPGSGLLITAGSELKDPMSLATAAGLRLWDVSASLPQARDAWEFTDVDENNKPSRLNHADQVCFGPRGDLLAFRTGERTLRLLARTETGYVARPEFAPFSQKLSALALSPDAKTLAVVGDGEEGWGLKLYNVAGKEPVPVEEFKPENYQGANQLSFSPDGKRLAAVEFTTGLSVYEVPSGRLLYHWETDNGPLSVAFAPDGRHVATANPNGTVYIFRLPEAKAKDAP